jgi:hypothetical protein
MTTLLTVARSAASRRRSAAPTRSRPIASVVTALAVLVCGLPGPAAASRRHPVANLVAPSLSAAPGTLVRWSAPGTERCGMNKRSWPALHETCYYPVDVLLKPGPIRITRSSPGHSESANILVTPSDYPSQAIELGDIPQAHPSPEDLRQAVREESVVAKVWRRPEAPALFTLPLGEPLHPVPEARDFGANRIFNGKPAGQPHMGADYTAPLGSDVRAVESGTVVLAVDQFFSGQAVYIDHGDGLVSMYFHLSEIKVAAGQAVKKGDIVGLVGSTGRSTGAHLFFGVRWHDARINPRFLFEDPAKIPAIGQQEPAGPHS